MLQIQGARNGTRMDSFEAFLTMLITLATLANYRINAFAPAPPRLFLFSASSINNALWIRQLSEVRTLVLLIKQIKTHNLFGDKRRINI